MTRSLSAVGACIGTAEAKAWNPIPPDTRNLGPQAAHPGSHSSKGCHVSCRGGDCNRCGHDMEPAGLADKSQPTATRRKQGLVLSWRSELAQPRYMYMGEVISSYDTNMQIV